MKSENINEIQKEDKSAFKKFLLLLFIGMLVGVMAGILTNFVEKNLGDTIADNLQNLLSVIAPYANIGVMVIMFIPTIYLYQKSRKLYQQWDGENEEQLAVIEIKLSYALWLTSLTVILSFFFFAIGVLQLSGGKAFLTGSYIVGWLGGFILVTIFTVIAQQKIVNFQKEINPEKKGSVFDQKFAKKWEESCDEAEKLAIYKASYKSYRAVTITCLILWAICIMCSTIWDFGLLPITFVLIIWIVQTTSYSFECIRLEKTRKE